MLSVGVLNASCDGARKIQKKNLEKKLTEKIHRETFFMWISIKIKQNKLNGRLKVELIFLHETNFRAVYEKEFWW